MVVSCLLKRSLALSAALALIATASEAGPNARAKIFLGNGELIRRVKNPEVDDFVVLAIRLSGTSLLKGGLVRLKFDGEFLEYAGFSPGDHPSTTGAFGDVEPMQSFSPDPVVGADGLFSVEAGGTLLGDVNDDSGSGLFGRFFFKIIKVPGDERVFISVVQVRLNRTSTDFDIRNFALGRFGLLLLQAFPNSISNIEGQFRDRFGVVSWETRFPGFDDVVGVDKLDEDGEVVANLGNFQSPFRARLESAPEALAALNQLEAEGIDILVEDDATVREALGLPVPPFGPDPVPALLAEARTAVKLLRERKHVVPIRGVLEPGMRYRLSIRSIGLSGQISPLVRKVFDTRLAPDLRRLLAHNLDIQRGRSFIAVRFNTNRPVVTNYTVTRVDDSEVVSSDQVNEDGATETAFKIEDLPVGTQLDVALSLAMTEDIPAALAAEFSSLNITRRITTRLLRKALRMAGPPLQIRGPEEVRILFRTPLPIAPTLSYGLVPDDAVAVENAKILQNGEGDVSSDELYTWSATGPTTTRHNITLAGDIEPSQTYRYKIAFAVEDVDGLRTFDTDPTGVEQWSRDLMFRTPAEGDTAKPELILGPRAFVTDELVVIQFATDVATTAELSVGDETTFGTADQFVFTDGEFSHRHSIVASGLSGSYFFGLTFTAASGQSGEYIGQDQPGGGSKVAAVQQPPGGGGSFTTSNDPDTQLPVILSGPTVTSKTHDTAIVEYTTDEPADTEVRFSTEAAAEETETSGVMETDHKVTLTNLTSGGLYSYLVASTDASGNGATESAMAVFTTDPEIDVTAPSLGDPVIIYKNDESATVQWTADEESTGEVEFGADTGPRLHPQLARDGLTARDHADEPGGEHEVFLQGLLVGFEQQRSQRVNGVFLHHRCDG